MDIFRKKKVRRLLNELEDINNELVKERGKTKRLLESVNNLEKISTQTLEENKKLIIWIEKILNTYGTIETRERHISIPIYKYSKIPTSYDDEYIKKHYIDKKEIIEIPSITIVKIG